MNTHTGTERHGSFNNFWAQLAMLTVGVIVLIALAALYIW
jgi:hypothetical protein